MPSMGGRKERLHMRRAIAICFLIFICLVSGRIAFSQSSTKAEPKSQTNESQTKKACHFSIVGLWRSDFTNASTPVLFNFMPEGGVTLLEFSAEALPQDFNVITAVGYKLDNPSSPRKIEFTAGRGNDAFPKGVTSLEIAWYSDDSFTTIDRKTGQQTEWVREQTRRYFLTFAARRSTGSDGGPAFAMLTTLDGRQTKIEALGIQVTQDTKGKTMPVFGPIPAELYESVREERDEEKKSDANKKAEKNRTEIMRLELTVAEHEKIHKLFEDWGKYVKNRSLPHSDPHLNVAEFFNKLAEPLNQCGEKLKLDKPNRATDGLATKDNLHHQPLEFIRIVRKKNDELHIPDASFPWGWQPLLQLPGQ
jgi:hypothetical protein